MNIITRNFFRLLSAGVFNESVKIEPMSAWKWRCVFQLSLKHDVAALTYDGTERCSSQYFMQLTDELRAAWQSVSCKTENDFNEKLATAQELSALLGAQQYRPILTGALPLASLYNHPAHRSMATLQFFFPFETQGKKAAAWARDNATVNDEKNSIDITYSWKGQSIEHQRHLFTLTNKLLNNTLQAIIEEELRQCGATYTEIGKSKFEVPSSTLALLAILLQIAHNVLSNTIFLKQAIDLGVFLRKAGHKVDFVKLQEWIERLHMKSIASLAGTLLTSIFSFSPDEIPFYTPDKKQDIEKIVGEMLSMQKGSQQWYFEQGERIFVHTLNSSAMMGQLRHTARSFSYYPAESVTVFFSSIAHSLSHIEE